MWASVIAVAGTLAGVLLASFTQRWTERRHQKDRYRQEVADRLADVLGAVLEYREVVWLRVDALRVGEKPPVDRATRYRARSAVTRARDRLALSTSDPALWAASEAAVWSSLQLSDIDLGTPSGGQFAPDVERELAAERAYARDAHTALREAGAEYVRRAR